MEVIAEPSGTRLPLTLMQVIEILIVSIEGYWGGKLRRARRTLALGARLLKVSERIEELLARLEAGETLWFGRRARQAAKPAAKAAPEHDGEVLRGPYRLPSAYGWLTEAYPQTAVYYGNDLIAAMQLPKMQALMLATPEVARLMRPVFRMLALPDDVLLVPKGYDGADVEEPVSTVDGDVAPPDAAVAEPAMEHPVEVPDIIPRSGSAGVT
jgi:hypothetical protein